MALPWCVNGYLKVSATTLDFFFPQTTRIRNQRETRCAIRRVSINMSIDRLPEDLDPIISNLEFASGECRPALGAIATLNAPYDTTHLQLVGQRIAGPLLSRNHDVEAGIGFRTHGLLLLEFGLLTVRRRGPIDRPLICLICGALAHSIICKDP